MDNIDLNAVFTDDVLMNMPIPPFLADEGDMETTIAKEVSNPRRDMEAWIKEFLFPCCGKCRMAKIRYEESRKADLRHARCYRGGAVETCPAYQESYGRDMEYNLLIKPPFPMGTGTGADMLDVKMEEAAISKSEAIMEIDNSWRRLLEESVKNTMKFPYPGESYNSIVMKNTVSVEGYCGTLKITKIYSGSCGMFALNRPIIRKNVRIYGVFNPQAEFLFYRMLPVIGYHFHGQKTEDMLPEICTGELSLEKPGNLAQLKKNCANIVKSQEVLNADSIGKVHMSNFYNYILDSINSGHIERIAKKLL